MSRRIRMVVVHEYDWIPDVFTVDDSNDSMDAFMEDPSEFFRFNAFPDDEVIMVEFTDITEEPNG